jgi:hypothetical protein
MWSNCQKDNGIVWEIFTEAIQTLRNAPTFLANHEDDTETSSHRCAATSPQIQCTANVAQNFGAGIGIGQYPVNTALDLAAQ